jgi:ribose/xylose/arabinose/galactoside ABC-type transport system permease subunit
MSEKIGGETAFSEMCSVAQTVHRIECMNRCLQAANPDERPYIKSAQPVPLVAPFLLKLAKHMALLVSLVLIGKTRGEPIIGPLGILLVIIGAALIHSVGRWLQMRPASDNRFLRGH